MNLINLNTFYYGNKALKLSRKKTGIELTLARFNVLYSAYLINQDDRNITISSLFALLKKSGRKIMRDNIYKELNYFIYNDLLTKDTTKRFSIYNITHKGLQILFLVEYQFRRTKINR